MKIVVIGGGAAGFFGAIACAEANPFAQVMLLEAMPQVLAKVSVSGGGRCNVTHACFEPNLLIQHYPRGSKALRGVFSRFQPKDTVAWFQKRGVSLKTEADGRMFPITDDSATIIDCLVQSAQRSGVQVLTRVVVAAIARHETDSANPKFRIQLKTEQPIFCDRILLATGSHPSGYQLATQLGHTLIPSVPSLFTFKVTDSRIQDLGGVSVPMAHVKLLIEGCKPLVQTGPLLITHWGLSGPAILKLSAWGARLLHENRYQGTLWINWVPQLSTDALRKTLLTAKTDYGKRAIANHNPVSLPQRLWQRLTTAAGIDPHLRWADCPKQTLNRLMQELQQGQFEIKGKGVFKEEFVACGGIPLTEVNFKTMESRCCPGLYFAGEILDIDGVTGGFNFQNAWSTSWIAGQSMAN